MVPTNQRNEALDGMRGFCALAVMLVHFSHFNGLTWFKNVGAGVDAFFIISGFVISQSYTKKILNNYSFISFFKLRIIRLAPLNIILSFFGLLIFVLIIKLKGEFTNFDPLDLFSALIHSFFIIPYFNTNLWPFGNEIQSGGLFPLNLPSWSLFFELIAYISFFYIAKFLNKFIILICIIFYFFYFFCAMIYGYDNPGWDQTTMWLGIPRVLFGFFVGVLIQNFYKKLPKINTFILLLIVIVTFFLLLFGNHIVSLVNTFIFIPLTILLIANTNFNLYWKNIFILLGELSFPIYISHIPIATFFYNIVPIIKILSGEIQIIFLSMLVFFMSLIFNFVDKKIRSFLIYKLC